jgi:hypothetical protein
MRGSHSEGRENNPALLISVGSPVRWLTSTHDASIMKFAHQEGGANMPDIERTSAGFQIVIPGCERRTFPKSATASDDTGQGLLDFYRPPTLREKLDTRTAAPMQPRRPQYR